MPTRARKHAHTFMLLCGPRSCAPAHALPVRRQWHCAVVIEWVGRDCLTLVELAWLGGLGGYGGKSNWYADQDTKRTALTAVTAVTAVAAIAAVAAGSAVTAILAVSAVTTVTGVIAVTAVIAVIAVTAVQVRRQGYKAHRPVLGDARGAQAAMALQPE